MISAETHRLGLGGILSRVPFLGLLGGVRDLPGGLSELLLGGRLRHREAGRRLLSCRVVRRVESWISFKDRDWLFGLVLEDQSVRKSTKNCVGCSLGDFGNPVWRPYLCGCGLLSELVREV